MHTLATAKSDAPMRLYLALGPALEIATIASALIAALAAYVLAGWMTGSEWMVRVVPNSAAMSFNTAILFLAVSICLSPAAQLPPASYMRRGAAWFLVVLPCVILVEHCFDFDLGIDWVALHDTVKDGNPRPGRTAPNAIIAFLLAAVCFHLLKNSRTRTSRTLQGIVSCAIYGTMAIGVTALVGYVLDLEILYRLENFNRMAAPTAAALTLTGIGLKARLNHAPWYPEAGPDRTMNRVVRASATALTVVAFVTGLTGFAMLKGTFDKSNAEIWLQRTQYTTSLLVNDLDQHFLRASSLPNNAVLRQGLAGHNRDPSGPASAQSLRTFGESIVGVGVTEVTFLDARGDQITSVGTRLNPSPVIAVEMERGATHGKLLWDDGFVLRTEESVNVQGRIVGQVVAWQRLPAMTAAVENIRQGSGSTDILICARDGDDALCFPSRFYPNLRIPLTVDGKPYLAISRALLGEEGVMAVDDARGKSVLAGYQPIGDYGLGLVLKADRVDQYASIRQRLNLFAGLLILLIAGGTLVLRAHLKPLSRRLVDDHRALKESEERLTVTLRSIGDAVITVDLDRNVSFMNPVAEKMTGWTNEQANGRPLTEVFHIVHAETGEVAANPLDLVLSTGDASALGEGIALVQRGGARFVIEDSAASIRSPSGEILGAVLVFHDVTRARAMAAEMTHQATHDLLTGLINRREFERRLQLSLQTARVQGEEHSLLCLDLDQFKTINDRCGHGAGDELLRQLTSILQEKLRRGDTLSRLGGDEFGVLLESCGPAPALRIGEMLRQTVSDFRFAWDEKVFTLSVSIGLVTYSDGDLSLTDILRMADSACYVAKDRGRNRIHVYTPDDEELALRSGQMGWIGRIQKALEDHQFVLFSQRILALDGDPDQDSHYELLLRLRNEDGGWTLPMAFISAAERYGLMPSIDRWVISTAFAHLEGLQRAPGMCAINLSANSICDETFSSFIQEAFKRYAVSPEYICFEITETAAVTNLKQAMIFIRSLKAMGCKFALDDFGSGMSSFAHLKHLPVDFLKIDGGFVKDMVHDPIDRAMVKSINDIGHVMGLKSIAEFVEDDAILAELKRIGVDFAQGYGIGKPQPWG